VKVPAQELDRLIQNVLLYADEKAMRLNEILIYSKDDRLYAASCDDYVAVSDWILLPDSTISRSMAFLISDIDALGDWIKKDKKVVHKYDIKIQPKFTGLLFECDETSSDEESDNFFVTETIISKNWDVVDRILDLNLPGFPIGDWAVRPERLQKIARLKADKEAPIHIKGSKLSDRLLIQFKKGRSLVGAIMPVVLDDINEEFLWQTIEA
jgi:hypothetical protein